jgi:arabinan endo-1,5-alpha-L-arabinosidase
MGGAPSSGGAMALGGSAGKASGGSGGAINAGGTGAKDLCPRVDSASPLKTLTLSGSLGAHDPALIAADNQFYLFATGLGAKTSKDLMAWTNASAPPKPAWVAQQVSGATNLWAPDISFFGGNYHLYYAASTFGSNHSCIGHATRASLSSGAWADQGSVICSNASGSSDNWNAIDPNVIVDEAGTPWLNFGSFWGGIKMIKLDATGARADTQLLSLAARPQNGGALEGPFIIRQCGYYYLFVSFDHCCDSPWNYNIRVGRSTSVTGPYTDKAGTAMMQGGGTLLVEGNTTWQGPGHNAVIVTANGAYNVYHALNPANHASSLRVAQMAWDADGWPVSAGP